METSLGKAPGLDDAGAQIYPEPHPRPRTGLGASVTPSVSRAPSARGNFFCHFFKSEQKQFLVYNYHFFSQQTHVSF